jgi:electron transfer flavoprotein-quinone oxidoreductase
MKTAARAIVSEVAGVSGDRPRGDKRVSSDEKFDAIVVGGGLAGCAAAYTLAKEGLEVALIERGQSCGAKNVTGGRLYAHSLDRLIPDFEKAAPLERRITKERVMLSRADDWTTIEYGRGEAADNAASYSVLRNKLDAWLAERAEEAGAMPVCGIRVDKLFQKDGAVRGVVADGDVLEADCVILAEGVNGLLAQKVGMKKELMPHQVAVGVKEIIALGEEKINDRFGLESGEGAALLIAGDASGGAEGGGFLYTNKNSISIGTVATLSHIGAGAGVKVPDMIDRLKAHPGIAPLIRGGEVTEYAAHLVPEAGANMTPELFWNGVLACGDAAGFVMNMGFTFRGMDLAIESGRLAALAVIHAKAVGDFSAQGLSFYRSLLEASFVLRDLAHYRGMPSLMDSHLIYDTLPGLACDVLAGLFTVDGYRPRRLVGRVTDTALDAGSLTELAALGYRAACVL